MIQRKHFEAPRKGSRDAGESPAILENSVVGFGGVGKLTGQQTELFRLPGDRSVFYDKDWSPDWE